MADIAKLRIERKGIYEIEVNDNGDTISFDTYDIELPFKFNDAFKRVQDLMQNVKRQMAVIDKKKAKPDGFLTSKDAEYRKLIKKTYAEMREAMDMFLGKGACQKIFGDRNYVEMYNDLYEMLEPHLEAMGIFGASVEYKIAKKYGDGTDEVLE